MSLNQPSLTSVPMCKSEKPDSTYASAKSTPAVAPEPTNASCQTKEANLSPLTRQNRFGEEKQADTKTLFDSLRNMGICIAMLLGLPSFYGAAHYLPNFAQTVVGCLVIGGAIALAWANITWTLQSLKERSSPWAKFPLVAIGSAVIIVFVVSAFYALPGF